jgi:hypothetical protein
MFYPDQSKLSNWEFFPKNMFAGTAMLGFSLKVKTYTLLDDK